MSGRTWHVTYRAHGRAPVEVWLCIAGVPDELDRSAVVAALEVWPRWGVYRARAAMGSTIQVRPARARDGEHEPYAQIGWDQLAPPMKRITVQLDGELYAAARRRAQLAGLSLAAWTIAAIRDAAEGLT